MAQGQGRKLEETEGTPTHGLLPREGEERGARGGGGSDLDANMDGHGTQGGQPLCRTQTQLSAALPHTSPHSPSSLLIFLLLSFFLLFFSPSVLNDIAV